MRPTLIAMLFAVPTMVAGEEAEWQTLDGAGIRAVLTDSVLDYTNGWQDFRASGRTLYHVGTDSWGYWEVRGDQYCSQWPPSDLWACYDMQQHANTVRFIGPAGDTTDGVLRVPAQ